MSTDWKKLIPPKRHGAEYFLNHAPHTWTAVGYFDARDLTHKNEGKATAELVNKGAKEYQQRMAHQTRKRALDIRKQNVKQHRIDSAAMTRELAGLHRPPLPSENKVALELKDCLDNMAKQHVNLKDVRVFGIVMIGAELDLYAMSLDVPGLFIMRQLNKAYLPRNHFDLAVLPQTINFFMTLQRLLQDSYALCARPRLDHAHAGVCASLGTPIKVLIT
ncbi:hypothetical protein B0O80DRAFT_528608 [Mortierella sp. GBAus27b]|nr:hypothetical protein B0O80DRAFT_528608 [Mortierella sp. GBAus27b]